MRPLPKASPGIFLNGQPRRRAEVHAHGDGTRLGRPFGLQCERRAEALGDQGPSAVKERNREPPEQMVVVPNLVLRACVQVRPQLCRGDDDADGHGGVLAVRGAARAPAPDGPFPVGGEGQERPMWGWMVCRCLDGPSPVLERPRPRLRLDLPWVVQRQRYSRLMEPSARTKPSLQVGDPVGDPSFRQTDAARTPSCRLEPAHGREREAAVVGCLSLCQHPMAGRVGRWAGVRSGHGGVLADDCRR